MARKRGRPPGRTEQGEETRDHLYATAIRLFTERGYEATTLRAIATEAGVSPGLLYRYFPSKSAVVLALYDALTRQFAERATLEGGRWVDRFETTLRLSLGTLDEHRPVMRSVLPAMLTDPEVGLLSEPGRPARLRVRDRFVAAVVEADDAPTGPLGPILGRLLDLAHLGVLLFWFLDRSPDQRATEGLLAFVAGFKPVAPAALWLPGATRALTTLDRLVEEGLYGEPGAPSP